MAGARGTTAGVRGHTIAVAFAGSTGSPPVSPLGEPEARFLLV